MYSAARRNGYEMHVNYQQMTLCGTDPPMVEYHNNEVFAGDFIPDYAGENWDPIPNGGVAGSLSFQGTQYGTTQFLLATPEAPRETRHIAERPLSAFRSGRIRGSGRTRWWNT